jgi:hypothetical protein
MKFSSARSRSRSRSFSFSFFSAASSREREREIYIGGLQEEKMKTRNVSPTKQFRFECKETEYRIAFVKYGF